MSFKEKLQQSYTDNFMKKNGDRLTQVQGNVLSVKVECKTILWIFHKLIATILVKPDRSRTLDRSTSIVKCVYRRNRWFKKPEFMTLNKGNIVIVQGLKGIKGKKGKQSSEVIEIMNVRNLTTKKDLVSTDGQSAQATQVRKVKRMK